MWSLHLLYSRRVGFVLHVVDAQSTVRFLDLSASRACENDRWSRVESSPTISGSRGANLSHNIGLAGDGKCEQLTLFPMEDLST